ncbi:hypothetical protein BJX65DRAFT_310689 [Aspergillus insuetus]
MASTDPRPEPLDFRRAIICALPREFDAVEALFDEHYDNLPTKKQHGDPNFYRTGRIGTDYIVLTCLAEMGKGSAASAASALRISFPNIDFALVVGICGGVPFPTENTELILGDVIISHQVVKFDFGWQYPDRFEQKGSVLETLDRSHREIQCLFSGLRTRRERERFQDLHVEYLRTLEEQDPIWGYPGVDRDRLFAPACQHIESGGSNTMNECDHIGCPREELIPRLRLNARTKPRPLVHIGPVATGDTVMKSAEHRDNLARKFGIVAFEMEGGGVCDTVSCLLIKGACDYADSHKNKAWQDYAAASAAACAKALLRCITESKAQYGTYVYSQCLQTHTGRMSAKIISQSTTTTQDPDEYIQSAEEALHRLADNIPNAMMRRALLPAAKDVIECSRMSIRNLENTETFSSKPRETLFGTIRFQTQITEHIVDFGDEQASQTETRTSFIFHPAPWLMRLGLRYGLKAMAMNHHKTWRYTIQPVRAVPDDSLIFAFCRIGNVDAVRELLKRGYASVVDVNTNGWTPLHCAVYWGHLELTKLLISEGADRRANTYNASTPTSLLRCLDTTTKPLDLILLFRDCIEFDNPHSDGWLLLSSFDCMDGRSDFQAIFECLWFLVQIARAATNEELQEFDNQYAWDALARAYRRGDDKSIQTILEIDPCAKSYVDGDRPLDAALDARIFYCRDNSLIRQYFLDRELEFIIEIENGTPASKAMRFASVFFAWRFDMMDISESPDLDCVVRQEISDSTPLSLQKWKSHTLHAMFDLDASTELINTYLDGDPDFGNVLCAKKNCSVSEPAHLLHDNRLIVEPWWEELKHRIKTEKCICWMHNFVTDHRDLELFSHTPDCADHNMDLYDEMEPSADCSAIRRGGMGDSFNISTEVAKHGPIAEVTSWFSYCFSKYGGLRCTYKPQEYYCFDCLAQREGWDLECAAMHEHRSSRVEKCTTDEDDESEMDEESNFGESKLSGEENEISTREGKRKREDTADEGMEHSPLKRTRGLGGHGASIFGKT